MKKSLYLILLLFASLLTTQAQQTLYFHCKDGKSFACLTDEIDYIGFSKRGSSDYNNQIVYLKDGTKYEVLTASIDSVGFSAPEPVLTADGFIMDNSFSSYISDADTLKFTMDKNTPAAMLPKKGNVVASTFDNKAFPDGIMARVTSVTETGSGYQVQCEKAGIDDLYDEFFYYGYGLDVDAKTRSDETMEKELWNVNLLPDISPVMLGDYTIKGNSQIASKGKIKILLHKQKGSPTEAKFWFSHRFESSFGLSVAGKQAHDFGDAIPLSPWMSLGAIPTPIPGIFFTPIVKFKLYFEAVADMNLTFKSHANLESEYLLELKDNSWSAGELSNKSDCGIDETSLALDGWVGTGLQPEFLITLCGSQTGANIHAKAGIRMKTAFKFDGAKFLDNASFYQGVKDTKLTLSVPLMAWFNAQLGLWGPAMRSADIIFLNKDFPLLEAYILPSFTGISVDRTSPTKYKATVNVANRNLFAIVNLGVAAFDESNNLVEAKYNTLYQMPSNLQGGNYVVEFELESGKEYSFCPIVKIAGLELRSSETASFKDDGNTSPEEGMWYRKRTDRMDSYDVLILKGGVYDNRSFWLNKAGNTEYWERGISVFRTYRTEGNIMIVRETIQDQQGKELINEIGFYWRIDGDDLILYNTSTELVYHKFTPEFKALWDGAQGPP